MQDRFWNAMTLIVATLAAVFGTWALSAGAAGPDPHQRSDDTWITIDGAVEAVDKNRFSLDYGEGLVTVEMDDGDRDADAYALLPGDKVRVTGVIDDDFFETTKIEAVSVFVENLNTTFFTSARDEPYIELLDVGYAPPLEVAHTTLNGVVTKVNEEEFELATGSRMLRVDIGEMPYNPLDEEGYQKIEVGDRVRVVGSINVDLFEGREFEADSIVKMYRRPS